MIDIGEFETRREVEERQFDGDGSGHFSF